MKNRFWLFQRHGVFYLQDSQTRRKESLHTRDRGEAERLRVAHNDAVQNAALGMGLAKACLSAPERHMLIEKLSMALRQVELRRR